MSESKTPDLTDCTFMCDTHHLGMWVVEEAVAKQLETQRDEALAENKRLREWQPIETAPFDGTMVLLWDSRRELAITGHYHRDPGMNTPDGYEPPWSAWCADEDAIMWDDDQSEITHWKPFTPPTKQNEEH